MVPRPKALGQGLLLALAVAWLVQGVAQAAAPSVETYDVGAAQAEQVMEALRPLVGEKTRISHAGGRLVVVADPSDQKIVREVVKKLTAAPQQYTITIVQGASRGEAQGLLSGRVADRQSTRSARSGSQVSTLRVTSGQPAHVESGHTVNAVDAVYFGYFARGASRSERPITRGFSVTALERGDQVEVHVSPFIAREGSAHPEDRQLQSASTTLFVRPGKWVTLGGGDAPPGRETNTYSSGSRLEQSVVLLRVDVVDG